MISINPNTTSPATRRYWPELKNLSNIAKLELITLLSSSMSLDEPKEEEAKDGTSTFSGKYRDDSEDRLEAALARFHKDWGGDKDPMEIARELRQMPEMVRDVETW